MRRFAIRVLFGALSVFFLTPLAQGQACDPSTVPDGLSSTYTPGSGVLLQWNAVPSSVGVLLRATTPDGSNATKRIVGAELSQFIVPEAKLDEGQYTWRVQAACSTTPPFGVTPLSASDTFTVGTPAGCPASVVDADGNSYGTTEIGSQCWMSENLQTTHYNNGDPILTGLSDPLWGSTSDGAYALYMDSAALQPLYGLLYNWHAVNDARQICPLGWHVPTDAEWMALMDGLGGIGIAGGQLKAVSGEWDAPNTGATNSSGWTGLPGGFKLDNAFEGNLGSTGDWWTSSEFSSVNGWSYRLFAAFAAGQRGTNGKNTGFSVRCMQD